MFNTKTKILTKTAMMKMRLHHRFKTKKVVRQVNVSHLTRIIWDLMKNINPQNKPKEMLNRNHAPKTVTIPILIQITKYLNETKKVVKVSKYPVKNYNYYHNKNLFNNLSNLYPQKNNRKFHQIHVEVHGMQYKKKK